MTALEAAGVVSGPQPRLELGRVVRRTFGAIGANFVNFLLLAILFAAIPSVLLGLGFGYFAQNLLTQLSYSNYAAVSSLMGLAIVLLSAIPTYILIGALTQGSIVHYNGDKASFAECVGTGFRFLVPLVGLALASIFGLLLWILPGLLVGSLLAGFVAAAFAQTGNFFMSGIMGIVVGAAAFILPIMAVIRWSVAAPALVTERTGVMGAFKRSGNLTHSNRWAIFFLALIWVVMSVGIEWVVSFFASSALMGGEYQNAAGVLAIYGFTVIYSALNTMILASGQAALYYELRVLKEGATSEELAKVFE